MRVFLTILSGIKAREGAAEDLHKVAVAAQTGVHVSKVGVHMVSIPGESGKVSMAFSSNSAALTVHGDPDFAGSNPVQGSSAFYFATSWLI